MQKFGGICLRLSPYFASQENCPLEIGRSIASSSSLIATLFPRGSVANRMQNLMDVANGYVPRERQP